MVKRTIIEWLDCLPLTCRKQAIHNYNIYRQNRQSDNNLYDSVSSALKSAFLWLKTEEGDKYWRDIYSFYKTGFSREKCLLNINKLRSLL